MSTRDEMIGSIQNKQREIGQIRRRLIHDRDARPATDLTMYRIHISRINQLNDEIADLKELARLLPTEDGAACATKRRALIAELESKLHGIAQLQRRFAATEDSRFKDQLGDDLQLLRAEADDIRFILDLL